MTWIELSPPDRERACALLTRLYHGRNRIHGKGVRVPKTFPVADLAWLEEVGLAPNQRTTLQHAKVVRTIVDAKQWVSIADGARAFMAGLGEGPPHGVLLEAALMAHRLPPHRRSSGRGSCRVCMMGGTETVDLAERFLAWHTSGSGIPGDPAWVVFGLERLRAAPVRRLSKEAKARMGAILHALDTLDADAPMGKAIEAVRALEVLGPDPKGWRARGVLETLAFAGLLDAPPHHGVAEAWVDFSTRDCRPSKYVEVEAPLSYWRGKDGVHWGHAKSILGISKAQAAKASPARIATVVKTRPKTKAPPAPKRLGRRLAEAGDVWGIRVREDTYVLVYVWEPGDGDRPYALVEFLDWIGPTPPDAAEVGTFGLRARYDGRWRMRVHSLHKTTGSVLVATGVPVPDDARPEPDRTAGGAAKELGWLADACFPELSEL